MSFERSTRTFALLAVAFVAGCSDQKTDGAEERAPAADAEAPSGMFVGEVTETMDAGGYTYVRLEHDGETVWAAGPLGKVEVGEELGVSLGMKMDDFQSETLGRTFDAVYFVNAFQRGARRPTAGAAPGNGAPSKAAAGGMGGAHSSAPTPDQDLGDIATAEGGRTVADLWRDKNALTGASVTFRGRVVKYNSEIMGRNWLHVQDGSGDAAAGTNDVTVTTNDVASVGDLVLVTGTVAVDRDFGGGYRYGLIVEEANVERE